MDVQTMNGATRSYLSDLPDLLAWREPSPLIKQSCAAHISGLLSHARALEPETSKRIFALPDESRKRLLLAPAFLRALTAGPAVQLDALGHFIDVEEFLAGARDRPAHRWSALGDYYAGGAAGAATDTAEFDDAREYRAPRFGQMVLDAHSPHDDGPSREDFHARPPLAAAELRVAVDRLSEAVAFIELASPHAAAMVRNGARVLSLRRFANAAGKPARGSYSWRGLLGMIGVINPHERFWSTADLAEALVHESIHQTIYKLEWTRPLFVDPVVATKETVVSPWSGRTLAVTSFVHASFVWYGLWNFWCLCEDTPDVARLRTKAAQGFLAGSPVEALGPEARACIEPEARDAIAEAVGRFAHAH